MKRLLLLFILLVIYGPMHSQSRIKIVTGLSSSFSKEIISNSSSQTYGALGFDFGARYHERKWSLDLSLAYQFSSNVDAYRGTEVIKNSLLRSHYIGGSAKYLLFNRENRIRPFIALKILSEVGTNYKNGYLLEEDHIPKDTPSGTGQPTNPFYASVYQSTPFIGSAGIGCDIRIIENLHLNLGLGYGFRIMKTKDAYWYTNDNLEERAKDIPTVNSYSHMIDVKVGLSYVFLTNKTFTHFSPPF